MIKANKLAIFAILSIIILASRRPYLEAQNANQAALVVRLGDGNVQTRCIEFSEAQITGYDVLLRSGLSFESDVQGMGSLVCSIGGTGCPASDCLCQCQGSGDCIYWSYWHLSGGNWGYSVAGAAMYPVTDGAVEGWSWGPGAVSEAVPPPIYTFESICQAAVPTNTPVPTDTPLPLPSITPTAESIPPPEIAFWTDNQTLNAGSCTNLHWDVAHVSAVFLDNEGVSGQGSRQVCPNQATTYTLTVLHPTGEEGRSITINILPPAGSPAPVSPSSPTVTPQLAASFVQPTAGPTAAAEPPVGSLTLTSSEATKNPVATSTPLPLKPTVTTKWITVPPLPSPTAEATQVAGLPGTTMPAGNPGDGAASTSEDGESDILSYVPFLGIILALGLLLILVRRKTAH